MKSLTDLAQQIRLNPSTLLFALGGALLVAYAVLGVSLLNHRSDRDAALSQIEAADGVLAAADEVQSDLDLLPTRLEETQRTLAAAKAAFPTELDGNGVLETLLRHAGEQRVRVIGVSALPPASEETEIATFSSLGFSIELEGRLDQLIAFTAAVEAGVTDTSQVEGLTLTMSDAGYLLKLQVATYARAEIIEEEIDSADAPPDEATGEADVAPEDAEARP